MIKASDLFVKCLEAEGVEYIFGIPGEENIDLLESIRKSSIKLIVTRHEQAATFMAATYGRLTGKAGVALSTLGPGATNLVTGVAYAQLGGMPLLVITGQKPIKKSKQGQFQIIDVVGMMKPITKSAEQIHSGTNIPSTVRNAFKLAEEERPGAVHLEFPEDIAREEIDAKPIMPVKVRRPGPDPKAIEQAVEIILKARHPIILVAAGANRKMIHKRLTEFTEKTKIPFISTQMGKGVIDERLEQYIGTAALSQSDYLHCAFDKADVVLVIGHDIYEKPPAFMGSDVDKKIIHINFYPAKVDDVYSPTLEVVGDIAHTIWMLTEKISPQSHWDFSYFKKVKEALQKHIHSKDNVTSFPILPEKFVSDLRSVLPVEAIVTLDNGMYKLWISRNYPAFRQNGVILDNAFATMGAGLPAAIAAKLVKPHRNIIAVVGDGGFMMNSQELETAVRLKLDLIIIILNDNGYGMIKWKQDSQKLPSFGLDFNNPDFVAYANSYGAVGHKITKTEDFAPLIQKLLQEKGVHVVEVPIDYSENVEVFTKQLAKDVCRVI
ncbi:MAG TPA: acetolactate synthase large subunit [Patescibacteria group bacterium]